MRLSIAACRPSYEYLLRSSPYCSLLTSPKSPRALFGCPLGSPLGRLFSSSSASQMSPWWHWKRRESKPTPAPAASAAAAARRRAAASKYRHQQQPQVPPPPQPPPPPGGGAPFGFLRQPNPGGGGATASETAAATGLELNQILGRALNRTTPSTIRCTLINSEGKVQINHGEFKRTDLVAQFGLLPRDLRKLDVSTHNIVPAILVRDTSIVVNLLHIRAIIKSDCVLLVDVTTEDAEAARLHALFLYDLEHKLRQPVGTQSGTVLTYEQRALETILVSVVYKLMLEFNAQEARVQEVLAELERTLDRERLQKLLVQSKTLGTFVQKAVLIRNELQELIDTDKDIAGLYLSTSPPADDSDVEVMLESYYSQCEEVVQSAENLQGSIESTEEYINMLLDSNRNSLMLLEVRFQVGMLGLSCGSALAALYGMNLQNMIEDTSWGFLAVCSTVGVLSIATVVLGLRRLARIGKIKERFRQ